VFLDRAIDVPNATTIDMMEDIGLATLGEELQVFGYWGSCASNPSRCTGGSDTDSLEYMITNYISVDECERIWAQRGQDLDVGPDHFCVADHNTDDGGIQGVCPGDSGSPSVYDGKQMGINSWAPSSCDPSLPTGMTSVPHYYDWIQDQLECPNIPGHEVEVRSKEDIMSDWNRIISALPQNEVSSMEKALFHESPRGNNEAISVRNVVFLVMEISGILLISAVVLVLFYRRNIDEVEKEEMTPLLNKKDIEF